MGSNTALERRGVDSTRQMTIAETSAMAMAEREKHKIQARYQVAMMNRRNLDDVRIDLLAECDRPKFAAIARYTKPIGRGVSGPSIRFVESAIACMGNLQAEDQAVYDDDDKRIIEVTVTDLEKNSSHCVSVTVTKTVERSSGHGRTVLGERVNSYDKMVYIVVATDDELLNKQGSLVSKAIRTCGLRLIPRWLVDECMDRCIEVNCDRNAKDPDHARRNMLDAWSEFGVKASDIEAYLGHPLLQMSGNDWDRMRGLYNAVSNGETTWKAIADSAVDEGSAPGITPPAATSLEAYYAEAAELYTDLKDADMPADIQAVVGQLKRVWKQHNGDKPFHDEMADKHLERAGLK